MNFSKALNIKNDVSQEILSNGIRNKERRKRYFKEGTDQIWQL